MISGFRELLGKWVKKVKDVHTREELMGLYWNDVFSTVDVSAYGIWFPNRIPTPESGAKGVTATTTPEIVESDDGIRRAFARH